MEFLYLDWLLARNMTQTSGSFPALSDRVKKGGGSKKPRGK